MTVVDSVGHLENRTADCLDGIVVVSKDAATAAWTDAYWAS